MKIQKKEPLQTVYLTLVKNNKNSKKYKWNDFTFYAQTSDYRNG